MPNNRDALLAARIKKSGEFYTQYEDIQREINAYLEYNPDTFRDKVVLLPCDDPEWSNFTRFFAQNFDRLGIRKLISTSYATESKQLASGIQLSFDDYLTDFETNSPQYNSIISPKKGKIFTLTRRNKKIDINNLQWHYLDGDGDFRSDEVTALRDEADIIVTNPPFPLFRRFLAWIVEANKQFLIIGNVNSISYKDIFPLLQKEQMWLGVSISSGDRKFNVPDIYPLNATGCGIDENGKKYIRVKGVRWFTNLDHGRRHQPVPLMTMADNLRYSKHREIIENGYQYYDNFDAIDVPFSDAVPSDYNGIMGVPITFMDKYCPEQFEIVGLLQSSSDEQAGIPNLRYYDDFKEMRPDGTFTGSSGKKTNGNPMLKGKSVNKNYYYNETTGEYVYSAYARILIKRVSKE